MHYSTNTDNLKENLDVKEADKFNVQTKISICTFIESTQPKNYKMIFPRKNSEMTVPVCSVFAFSKSFFHFLDTHTYFCKASVPFMTTSILKGISSSSL